MVIAVCDKEQQVRDELAKLIPTFTEGSYRVKEFADVATLISYDGTVDIVLMDIGAKATRGMEIASKLREKSKAIVIFATANKTNEQEAFVVKTTDGFQKINRKEIFYAENDARKIILHTLQGEYAYYGKMKDLEEKLGDTFFRCHRGYLVALDKVKAYDRREIELINGEKLLLSKQKYMEFVQRHTGYIKRDIHTL